ERLGDLDGLLDSLVPDAKMRKDYPDLKSRSLKQKQAQQSGDTGPQTRKPEELRNVQVMAHICAAKFEWGKTGDNDFHVILSNNATAGAGARFMGVEVSALPVVKAATKTNPHPRINKRSPDYEALRRVRRQLVNLFPDHRLTDTFYKPARPIKVTITGSLHFDGDHTAGGANGPRPAAMNPSTLPQIHPVP